MCTVVCSSQRLSRLVTIKCDPVIFFFKGRSVCMAFLSFPGLVTYTDFCYHKVCEVALSMTTDVICQQGKKMWCTPICCVIVTEVQWTEAFAQWRGRKVVMRQISGFQSKQCEYRVGGVAGWKAEESWNFVFASLSLTLKHHLCIPLGKRINILRWLFFSWKETLKVVSGIWHVSVESCFFNFHRGVA